MRVLAWLLIVVGIPTAVAAAYCLYIYLRLVLYLKSVEGVWVNWPTVILVIMFVAVLSVLPLVIGLVLLRRVRRKSLPVSAGAIDQ